MMNTGVPMGTRGYSASESGMCMRMQPCDAYVPIELSLGVPWIRMPGADRYRARVPSGVPGAGGVTGGSPAPQPVGAGLCHVGLSTLAPTSHAPSALTNPCFAVATG